MPEGHSVHRVARTLRASFLQVPLHVSSPQGRFADGARILDTHRMVDVFAVGKQMFAEFEHGEWLRVHLGIYGAWDFTGPVTSIGAPRQTRVRVSEQSSVSVADADFPPPVVGAVRLRLLTERACADLRGPTACEVLDSVAVSAIIDRLGPDPQYDSTSLAEEKFVANVRARNTPLGQLLMDQRVVAGIGNVYRAELLFRAGIDPYRPGKLVTEAETRNLWRDWVGLLQIGIDTGLMLTRDDLTSKRKGVGMSPRAERHWVYKREGLPCRVCGSTIALAEMQARKLYWCPSCQT